VIDHVVEAVVAVHQHRLVVGRQVRRQPVEQLVHRLDALGLRCLVLLAPARDLARDVASRPAEISQTEGRVIDRMQARQHVELRLVDREAAFLGHVRQQRIPQHAAVAELHDVKRRPDHTVVLAQRVGPGSRDIGPVQRRNDAELPVDGMRRRQQLARRLAPQHVAAAGAIGQSIGGIGLAALELLDHDRRGESLDVRRHELLERLLIEAMLLLHRHRADIVRAFSCHPEAPERPFTLAGSLLAR
jgi:hypothetical protein